MIEFKKYNKIAGIYKFENKINHKCYIGLSINLGSRLRHHINNFKRRRYDTPLYRAFDKYGIESFDVEILYSIENPISDAKLLLDQLEIGYIETYNSYGKNGYNQTRGGDAGILGYKFTEEQRKRTSENSKISSQNSYKKVYLKSTKTGWVVSFPSITIAANTFNCGHSQITRLCNWSQNMFHGEWIGAFEENKLYEREEYIKTHPRIYTGGKYIKGRKHPVPGLKRHFNTPNGKKIISQEQREKIRNSLYRYIIYVYKDEKLVSVYNTSKELNDALFHYEDVNLAFKSIKKYMKNGWKYRGVYTFKLIDKKNIK